MQDLNTCQADSNQGNEALPQLDAVLLKKARGAAQAALDALMLTDAPLLYSPSSVALAALRAGFRKVHTSLLATTYLSCFDGNPARQQILLCSLHMASNNGDMCRLKYRQANMLHMLHYDSKR